MDSFLLATAVVTHAPPTQSITVSVWWLFAAGFFGALGAFTWKFLPWAIKRALDEKIDAKLVPMVNRVHTEMTGVHVRIDEHMDNEESSFDTLNSTVTDVSNQLIARDALFDGLQTTMDKTCVVLEQHMANDEAQFAAGKAALLQGQEALIARLESIERNTNAKAAEISANTDRNVKVVKDAVDTIVAASKTNTDEEGGQFT